MDSGETYIGDALFASYDGYQIRLRCAAPPCEIFLEPAVLQALWNYADNLSAKDMAE